MDSGTESSQFYYDSQNNRCSEENAIISFTVSEKDCCIVTTDANLVNVMNVDSRLGEYAVFIRGVEKVCKVGSDLLLYVDEEYKVYINSDSFIEAMEGRSYCYLNKIAGWNEIYGFAVCTKFIVGDCVSNSERIAVMYNALNLDNDWSLLTHKEKPAVSVKAVLQRYILI